MICEYCKNEHNGSYGSGRFCSVKCARGFSTSKKRKEINKKVSLKLTGYKCIKGGLVKLCDYGCGQNAKYKLKNGKWCCTKHPNKCPQMKYKNSEGLKKSHANKSRGPAFSKDSVKKSHEVRKKNLKKMYEQLPFEDLPIIEKRKVILSNQEHSCAICGIDQWNNKSIVLQLDHIDGNNKNNKKENLRMICPNCHSQTENFCGKNIKKNKQTISNEKFLQILKKSDNIHQALQCANLSPKGRNYKRAYILLASNLL